MELPWDGHGPDYDMTAEGRHQGAHYGPKCPACRIHTEASESYVCWTPGCPCMGLEAISQEAAETAAAYRRSVMSGRAADRTMTGSAALEIMERAAWLEQARAYGDVIDIVIEHRERE